MDGSNHDKNDYEQRLRKTADEIQKLVQGSGEQMGTSVKSALQAAYGSMQQAIEMLHSGGEQSRQGLAPTGTTGHVEHADNLENSDPVGGTDRSSGDPIDEFRTEVHPDDHSAPPSNTGHREVHPDDAE